jgi:alpha-mannosidase
VGNVLINIVTNLTGWERLVNTTMLAEGRHKFVSHLIFHPGDWKKFNLPAQAERFVRPPEILYVDKVKKGGLPGEFSFFSVSPSNLVTTGFYKQGKDYILRFYEAEGRKTSADIRFFKQVKQAAKTDMENNIIENVTAKGNSIRLDVAPCEIVTLHLRFYDYGIIIDKDTINQGGSTCQKYRKL